MAASVFIVPLVPTFGKYAWSVCCAYVCVSYWWRLSRKVAAAVLPRSEGLRVAPHYALDKSVDFVVKLRQVSHRMHPNKRLSRSPPEKNE